MKIAYGYNRPVGAFDHVSPDSVYIDTDKTDREFRADMFRRGGLRENDTLIMFTRGDLARGQALPIFEAELAKLGVAVTLIDMPTIMVVNKSGRPLGAADLDNLSTEDDATLKAMWKDPLIYTHRYCLNWVADDERLGKPVMRYQLDYRYGKRNDAKEGSSGGLHQRKGSTD